MSSEGSDERPGAAKPVNKRTFVSIRTVADRAGVSIATVSNVINNRTKVGAVLARRVLEAVEELGYVADGSAARLRSGRQALAGVIVPDLTVPMFGSFVSILESQARLDGFDLIVASCHNDPRQEAERLSAIRAWRPAGCIVIPVDGALKARRPRGSDMPIVAADRIPDDPEFDLITIDNAASAEAMVRHLGAQGYRRCLVAVSDLSISNFAERWRGAQQGARSGMALDLLVVGGDRACRRPAFEARLSAGFDYDVVFCLDNVTTLTVFQALGARGYAIPARVALAGFDDSDWMTLVTPPVSAVCQPVEAMAEAAWLHLMRRVQGEQAAPHTILLPCQLATRSSTAPRGAGPVV